MTPETVDYSGMATLITAIGALIVVVIGAVVNGLIAWKAATTATEAKELAVKGNEKIEELKVNNDGKLNQLMAAVKGQERAEGKAEGKREEKADQADRDAAEDETDTPMAVTVVNQPEEPVPTTVLPEKPKK